MREVEELTIHSIIVCAFVIAIACVVGAFATGEVAFLNVLMSSVTIALLAAILYVLEGMKSLWR